MWKSNLRIANDNDNIQAGTEVELATACWALHCTSIPIRIERDYRLEISITPVLTAQHRARLQNFYRIILPVCAHLWEENYKKAFLFFLFYIYEGNMQVYNMYTCILSLHIYVFLHIPYIKRKQRF